MSAVDAHIAADKSSMIAFLKGKSCVTGKFWLLNLLRFKPGGEEEYRRYAAALTEPMAAVGARPIFASYTCFTVVDGAGAIFEADGVFIGEYPSPAALIEMNRRSDYISAHKHRAAALSDTYMYAIPPGWTLGDASIRSHQRQPNLSIKAKRPRKTGKHLQAIDGEPSRFKAFMNDSRFELAGQASSEIWMLNFLRFEPGDGHRLYQEYGVRANHHISGQGGGLALAPAAVHALRGPHFDSVAIMKYPSRSSFLRYAMVRGEAGDSKRDGNEVVAEGFKLREAGLAVQGLVCMLPAIVYDSTAKSRL